jgi:hypothetical protein
MHSIETRFGKTFIKALNKKIGSYKNAPIFILNTTEENYAMQIETT